MKQKLLSFALLFLSGIMVLMINSRPAHAQASVPVVHAVLFYSPTCGHCHYIITEVLPPILEQYGDQLQIIGIDISQPDGYQFFLTTLQMFKLEQGGVPFLVVGDVYLVGDVDIPAQFPDLIDYNLARGGIGWPDILGLAELIVAAQSTQEAQPSPGLLSPTPLSALSAPVESTPTSEPGPATTPESLILTGNVEASLGDRFAQDPVGNGLAIVVLIGMLTSLGWGGWHFNRTSGIQLTSAVPWVILALCIVGLGVAGYLSYVEMTHMEAICGPVGDCNTVQQSEYARLFGILPIGVLGMAGYIMIFTAWLISRRTKGKTADYAVLTMLSMTAFGTLFSIYLTFLEPFVIGATCAWCLTSAVIMTILFLLSLEPGKQAVSSLLSRST